MPIGSEETFSCFRIQFMISEEKRAGRDEPRSTVTSPHLKLGDAANFLIFCYPRFKLKSPLTLSSHENQSESRIATSIALIRNLTSNISDDHMAPILSESIRWPSTPSRLGLDESDEKYTALPTTDSDNSEDGSHSVSVPFITRLQHLKFCNLELPRPTFSWRIITVITGMFIASVIFLAAYAKQSPASIQSAPGIMVAPCGSTSSEARARGCHFDVISFCWLPDACYDTELSDAFDGYTKWEWYLDSNKTRPISHELAMTGDYTDLFVNWEYHLRHCTAMWKKLHRAILGRGKIAIDGYIGPLAHTEHCSMMLLEDRDVGLEEINTIIRVKFPDCGIA